MLLSHSYKIHDRRLKSKVEWKFLALDNNASRLQYLKEEKYEKKGTDNTDKDISL